MMEALGSFETSVLTRTIRHNIPENGILNRLINGSEIARLARQPRFNLQKNVPVYVSVRGGVKPRAVLRLD
jgi:hypothetical protein